jgi:hypothetical protein
MIYKHMELMHMNIGDKSKILDIYNYLKIKMS